jgi:cardiolipin synthase
VVDGRVGFTGGTNIREGHSLNLKPDFPVRCLHFRFEGPIVVHLQEAFANDWAFADGEVLKGSPWFHSNEHVGPVGARGISDGPDEDLDKMSEVILGALTAARERVAVVTPYFLPDEAVQWALAVAAMRGVKVDIVIPEKNNIKVMDWATVPQLPFLLEKGCRIHKSPEPFDHTKLMIVDGIWSLVGSTNWDPRSLRLNFEYNIECYDEELAGKLEKLVESRIAEAREVSIEEVNGRPIPIRLRDGVCQMFSPYL